MCAISQFSGVKIEEVRIRNFRSLKEVDVKLDWLTVIIGENNAGKTSFLDALFVAIGAGRHNISSDDIFLAQSETKAPKEREVIIDLLIRPIDKGGNIIDIFPEGCYWIELYGEGISQDDDGNEFVAIRTQMRWDSTEGGYEVERKFLADWQDPNRLNLSKVKGSVSSYQIKPLALYLLDAKRDIKEEFQSRNSFWYKLISDLGLENGKITEIEAELGRINEGIISGSGVLGHLQEHLNDLYKTIGGDSESVSITPIPRHLRDLSKGVDVNYSTKGAQSFPLSRHGMGTRSLAAVLTFRAYMTWKQRNSNDNIHPMLALEEPESHLHPQAQRALFSQIEEIPGQRIISTHSPYIAGQTDVSKFRHFRKVGENTMVTQMDTSELEADDIHKIDRMVMNTRGEILYANALLLFEGEQTEDQALPIFAEKYWGQHPNALGISMVGVGGNGRYLPFLRLARSFQIPWYIFSDGESETITNVDKALSKAGEPITSTRRFTIPDGKNFEEYISVQEYEDVLIDVILCTESKNPHHKAALKAKWEEETNPLQEICSTLEKNKTLYGKQIADAITGMEDEKLRFPPLIRSLFEKMSDDLGLEKRG
ncbi:ATP-dependent nuclease [Methanothrix harundinacea]|uniref:ATP-dependent OLD family endonuclease n=1 Tax=Methanothrix harundinacea (strain 6Ac) TaxID=1110509 RepID=G7WLT7_METH6|nr:AAA family ATPase [Methanothrix harundinacea]AET63680.1 ATP-dependent OLD family endonuclease [Methanothrix harundinacea 6Ac]